MFLDTLNQNFCLIISCPHFPKKFYSRVTTAILPSVAIDNHLHLIIKDFHHSQNYDINVKQTNPRYKGIFHIFKYKTQPYSKLLVKKLFFVSKIIEHKLMLFKHNNPHVLLYQIEKSFDACNGSYCPKLILYFDYCNT